MTAPPAHAASWESGEGAPESLGFHQPELAGGQPRLRRGAPHVPAELRLEGGPRALSSWSPRRRHRSYYESRVWETQSRPRRLTGLRDGADTRDWIGRECARGLGQRRRSEQSLGPRASERPRPLGAALGATEPPRTGPGRGQGCGRRGGRPCGAEESESHGRRQGPGVRRPDTAPRWGPSLPGKPEPGGLLGSAFPPSPHPRPPRPHKPSVQRPTAWAAALPSPPPPTPTPTPTWRPSEAASSSSRVFPDHTWSPLPGILSNSCGLGPSPPPKGGGQACRVPASTRSSPRAQQGLRGGRVVKLQFISVETEAQETGEPPRQPPKGMLTTWVSFPRPLPPHSHPRLSPPAAFRGPSPSTPRAHTLLPQGLGTCSPHRKLAHHHSRPSKTAEAIPTPTPTAACSSPV